MSHPLQELICFKLKIFLSASEFSVLPLKGILGKSNFRCFDGTLSLVLAGELEGEKERPQLLTQRSTIPGSCTE